MIRIFILVIIDRLVGCYSEDTIQHIEQNLVHPSITPGFSGYGFVIPNNIFESPLQQQQQQANYHKPSSSNPLLEALLLSKPLGIPTKFTGYNTPQHQPINPYIALLLSHYGRYVAVPGAGKGIYSYGAANDYHNNKPFGSYKIYEENDS